MAVRSLLTVILIVLLFLAFPAADRQPAQTCQQMFAAALAQSSSNSSTAYCWGVIGNTGKNSKTLRNAGIQTKVFSLSWKQYMPASEGTDPIYVQRKRTELAALRADGFAAILILGIHDTPSWVHAAYPDSYYVNQYGEQYPEATDAGDLNLVFNPALRALTTRYIATVFGDFGTDFLAVRAGGGRYGELTYPPAVFNGHTNTYWVFDANAARANPAPGWRPGDPSPNGEAERFLRWSLGALVDFQQWQIQSLRAYYGGPIMMLYPSWGIRPGDFVRAVATNLGGSSSAEINGEIQRGFDFASQIAAVNDPKVIVTTTWLDADASADPLNDPRYWSPVKYLYSLTDAHPLHLRMFGENTGQGMLPAMTLSVEQTRRYRLLGMAWFREEELLSGQYATLRDYANLIKNASPGLFLNLLPLVLR